MTSLSGRCNLCGSPEHTNHPEGMGFIQDTAEQIINKYKDEAVQVAIQALLAQAILFSGIVLVIVKTSVRRSK